MPANRLPNLSALRGVFLFVRCHDWFFAVDASLIERIVLPEEVRQLSATASRDVPGNLGLVMAGSCTYSAWDMGELFGQRPLQRAWLLIRQPQPGGDLPLALRTGTCLSVGTLAKGQETPIPGGIFRSRSHAILSAFPSSVVRSRRGSRSPVGLRFSLQRLWTEQELRVARWALEQAEVAL